MTANASLDPYLPYPVHLNPYSHSTDASTSARTPAFTSALPPLGTENLPDKARYHRHDQGAIHQRAGTQDYALPPSLLAQQPPFAPALQPPSTARDGAYSAYSPYTLPPMPEPQPRSRVDERLFIDQRPTEGKPTRDPRFLVPVPPVPPPEPPVPQEDELPTRSPATVPIEAAAPVARDTPAAESPRSRSTRRATSNVVIACRQCRARKIKCDSTRPSCHNCERRQNLCEYDPAPKRRGPDKRPGTRQRACSKRQRDEDSERDEEAKRRRFNEPLTIIAEPHSASLVVHQPPSIPPTESTPSPVTPYHPRLSLSNASITSGGARDHVPVEEAPVVGRGAGDPTFSRSVGRGLTADDIQVHGRAPRLLDRRRLSTALSSGTMAQMPGEAEGNAQQREWWTRFLARDISLNEIRDHFVFLFKEETPHWLTFLHLESFLDDLYDDTARLHIQPALIYASLALATLMRSSQAEWGTPGRNKALYYRESARAYLKSPTWIDLGLAEAAIILAVFEMSLHPQHTSEDLPRALADVDRLITRLGLLSRDADDADTPRFAPRQVPSVPFGGGGQTGAGCKCTSMSAADAGAVTRRLALPWPARGAHDEEARRVCWAAVSLVAAYAAECAAFGRAAPHFEVGDAANISLLFPNEVADRENPVYRSADPPTQKETVWALYCRAMLLWLFVVRLGEGGDEQMSPTEQRRMRAGEWGQGGHAYDGGERAYGQGNDMHDRDRAYELAEGAQEAFGEAQAIEDALALHTCNSDTVVMYLTREYVFNVRTTVAKILRRLQGLGPTAMAPFPSRKRAEEWVQHQGEIVKRLKLEQRGANATFARKPFAVTWFSNQLALTLSLWNQDKSFAVALVLAKNFMRAVEVGSAMWPSPVHDRRCAELRGELIEACKSVGVDPPLPPMYPVSPV